MATFVLPAFFPVSVFDHLGSIAGIYGPFKTRGRKQKKNLLKSWQEPLHVSQPRFFLCLLQHRRRLSLAVLLAPQRGAVLEPLPESTKNGRARWLAWGEEGGRELQKNHETLGTSFVLLRGWRFLCFWAVHCFNYVLHRWLE